MEGDPQSAPLIGGGTGLYGFAYCVGDDRGGRIRVRHTRTRLLLQALLVAMLLVGVGVTGVFADNALQRVGREQVETAAQLSEDARPIYKSLAKADSFATRHLLIGFVSKRKSKVSSQEGWEDYDDDIRRVYDLLLKMMMVVGGDLSRKADIDKIGRQLSTYTRLVDEAKKLIDDAREVFASTKEKESFSPEGKSAVGRAVLGASRMHEASFYMYETLLKAVMDFGDYETDNLRGAGGSAFWSWASRLLLLAGLGGLAWIQWSMARRTHRFLNYGLLGATVLMVVMLGVTGWSLQRWSEAKVGLGKIENILNERQRGINIERGMWSASANLNLFLIGAGAPDLNAFSIRFKDDVNCAANESLCCAYDRFIYSPLFKGNDLGAAIAALPDGDFALKFDVASNENAAAIESLTNEINQKAKELPSVSPRSELLIVLLCSCAAVCAGLGFWIRIREYL